MKKVKKIIVISALFAALLCGTAFADGNYTSSSDPLITLSYVNSTLKSQIVEEVLAEVAKTNPSDGGTDTGVQSAFEVVSLSNGETLMASGSCEIILRSGSATAVVTSEVNISSNIGLSDLTVGEEITNGNSLSLNDYILIPRGDGRGAFVTSDTAYFMVRGAYEIVK